MKNTLNTNELLTFYELSSDIFCIASSDGIASSVNKACEFALGYPRAILYETPLLNFVHHDDLDATSKALVSLLKQEVDLLHINNRIKCQSGAYLALSWRVTFDVSSQKFFATARDMTNELNAKSQLYQLQHALLNETIVSQTDKRGIITDVNERFCKISGFAAHELIGKTHQMVNSGIHPREFFKTMWQKISRGQTWEGTITNRRKDGGLYYVRSIIIPMKDHNDEITHYLSVRQDITDSIVNQVELTKTLNILNETSAIAKVGGWELKTATGELIWTDETFKILEVDKRTGHSPTLPEGINLYVEAHQPIIEKAVHDAMYHGKPYALELLAKTAKGNERWVFTNGKANYSNGKIYSISGTIQDIHEQKLAEQALAIEKQRSIQNSKLASLGELAASIAHEINNPLGIISGSAQLLELPRIQQNPESVQAKALTIIKSTQRIEHITKSLRRFARSSFDDMDSSPRIDTLLHEALSLTKPNLRRHLIELTIEGESDAQIRCNEIELEQVFINLINNAVDAIKATSNPWIRIELLDLDEQVQVNIIDSGHGIPETLRQKLFEPFYTTKPKGQGTGLGLSICKEICVRHNAVLWLDSSHSNTCFSVLFTRLGEGD
ncbi:probable sensory transduction histidine kinase [Pseudoalteromonas luteoviolacea B = ATCC 29581]|nr:probable sensory transduction histidine kinase [Pseudoalteromonas luteoviolacea B = ATCC 29581]